MSGAEKVNSFNPIWIVIWITQILIVGVDYAQDGRIVWSIPIVGSVFIVQVYMIWKTNYDEMMEERQKRQARALGGPIDTPKIVPGQTKLKDLYPSKNNSQGSKDSKKMINLNAQPSDEE